MADLIARRLLRLLPALALLALEACAPVYTGAARDLDPSALRREPGWTAVQGVPLYRQSHERDCGPTALAMVVAYYRPELDTQRLLATSRDARVSAAELRDRARELGLLAYVVEGKPEDLAHELRAGRPVIVGMAKPTANGGVAHFEVLVGIHARSRRVATLDPAAGYRQNSLLDFMAEWQSTGRVLLVIMPPRAGSSAPLAQRSQAPTSIR
jgi:ABC-type bacteriocin/lantibiotic exporter with double-glycine peptidase domain